MPLDRRGPDPFDVTDPDAVRTAFQHPAQPDAVYHLAALSHVGESWKAPALAFRVNAEGTLNVLRACVDLKIERVLIVGSAEEYGKVDAADLPLPETAPLRPITPYGTARFAADYLALQAFIGDELGVIRARPFGHTGPGQEPRFVTPALASRIRGPSETGSPRSRSARSTPVRDLSNVRDVVRAYRLLVERGEPGEVYNVCSATGSPSPRSPTDCSGTPVRETAWSWIPSWCARFEVAAELVGASLPRAATGWEPAYHLDTTLTDVPTRPASPSTRR